MSRAKSQGLFVEPMVIGQWPVSELKLVIGDFGFLKQNLQYDGILRADPLATKLAML